MTALKPLLRAIGWERDRPSFVAETMEGGQSVRLFEWCNSYDWTVANQALTIRKVQKVVQKRFPICRADGRGQWSVIISPQ